MKTITISDRQYAEICAEFGRRLKMARDALGWTQAEFADNLGYKTASSISAWERGRGLPRSRTLYHLAHWMGWSIDYLFGLAPDLLRPAHRYHKKTA